jgi:hypothetical protein
MEVLKNLLGRNAKINIDEVALKQGSVAKLLSEAVIVESGTNANGSYLRFGDGTQICWIEDLNVSTYESKGVLKTTWTLPMSYPSDNGQMGEKPAIFIAKNEYRGSSVLRRTSGGGVVNRNGNYAEVFVMVDTGMISGWVQGVRAMTIGRWK